MAFSCSITDWVSNMREGHNPSIAKYIDDEKFERYNFAMGCRTIPWEYTLSPEGLALQAECQARYDAGQVKTHFKYWAMDRLPSGPIPGCPGAAASMCSNQNISLLSPLSIEYGEVRQAQTSVVKMFAPDNSWALTASGSMYSLGDKVYSDEFLELFNQGQVSPDDTYIEKLRQESQARADANPQPGICPVLALDPTEGRVGLVAVDVQGWSLN